MEGEKDIKQSRKKKIVKKPAYVNDGKVSTEKQLSEEFLTDKLSLRNKKPKYSNDDIYISTDPTPTDEQKSATVLSDIEGSSDDVLTLGDTEESCYNVSGTEKSHRRLLPPVSDYAKSRDTNNFLLPNQDNSCFGDCVMEFISRIVLKNIKTITAVNGMNQLIKQLQRYAKSEQFAQALDLARSFVWKCGVSLRGLLGDFHDLLHAFGDNHPFDDFYTIDNALQPYSQDYAEDFGRYVIDSVDLHSNRSIDDATFSDFFFLSNSRYERIPFPEAFELNGNRYNLYGKIYSTCESAFDNSNDESKDDALKGDDKDEEVDMKKLPLKLRLPKLVILQGLRRTFAVPQDYGELLRCLKIYDELLRYRKNI
ncbi:hypothetical protein BC941DRAFT_472775 [Chlamydoabsidia padenii]|nr:hypothetical protein BC941DRAFT_472775 [Chlamydoabsidia padenii]